MFDEVPVLPVVVPLGVATLGVLVWHLRRRGLLTLPRAAVALALSVYVAGVVANTVFPIYLDKPAASVPWHTYLVVTPLGDYEAADALTNIAVFVPLGALLLLALPRWPWWRALAGAAVFSVGIELSQYVTAHLLGGGHVADVHDLAFNVVGAAVGSGLLLALTQVPRAPRLVDRFRWA
ncbi:VanZ family protein [Nocardioides lijunqiniae]|uniref:VanZ family protein n=1 Tax=Nocardioides lijunqiniae TaxID=2760832 RepID=UPI001878CBDA|nr:VanZ family protein [Nocardioides lijunqiniae]